MSNKIVFFVLLLVTYVIHLHLSPALACRVGSDKLKAYTKKSIARLLTGPNFKSIYWQEEPLNPV